MTRDRLLDDYRAGAINVMKGFIVYSNFVTTVSPRYAQEIRHSNLGMGMQRMLEVHHQKFGGVLNGIDYGAWNPELDPHIPNDMAFIRFRISSPTRRPCGSGFGCGGA